MDTLFFIEHNVNEHVSPLDTMNLYLVIIIVGLIFPHKITIYSAGFFIFQNINRQL